MPLPHQFAMRHVASISSRTAVRLGKQRRPCIQSALLVQTRTKSKRSAASRNDKKAAISRAIASNRANSSANNNSVSGQFDASTELVYGMRPVDYSVLPPIRHSPPPPPVRPGFQKYLWPAVLLFTASTVGYFYVNNKNDNYEYWRAMQSGEALQMDDDGEYDDEEEEDEEEDEEEFINQSKQLNVASETQSQRRGWFGWLRGWKRGDEKASSGGE